MLRIRGGFGGGYGCLADGTFGESHQYTLNAELVQGALPPPGSHGILGRTDGTITLVTITGTYQQSDGRLAIDVDGLTNSDLGRGYVLASDQALFSAVAVPTPVPGAPTAADGYPDYQGPPLNYTLERAIRACDEIGTTDGYGQDEFRGGRGYLHGLYDDPQFGPR